MDKPAKNYPSCASQAGLFKAGAFRVRGAALGAAVLCTLAASPALAQSQGSVYNPYAFGSGDIYTSKGESANDTQFSLGVGVATLGPALTAGMRFSDDFGVRLPVSYIKFDGDLFVFSSLLSDEDDDNTYVLGGAGLLADWYFTGGSYRLSLGALYNYSRIEEQTNVQFNGETVRTEITPDLKINPTVAIGADYQIGNSLGLSWDLGASYIGKKLKVDVLTSGVGAQKSKEATDYSLDTDSPVFNGGVFPYISVSLDYRF